MDLVRVGEKLISRRKIERLIDHLLELRTQGKSQQEVAQEVGIDRVWISKLETIGEVRKGGRVALIGFPVANVAELERMAQEEGVEFCLLLTDKERWNWLDEASGAHIFNRIMELITEVKDYDSVVFIGSDMRIRLMESLLGRDIVVGVEIGASPIQEDKQVSVGALRDLIRSLRV